MTSRHQDIKTSAHPHNSSNIVTSAALRRSRLSEDGLSGIALVQMDVAPGHPDRNFEKILAKIAEAKSADHDVVVFPEMALSGYLLGDAWENDAFIRDLMAYNERIREASRGITVIWGSVWADFNAKGEDGRRRKYNAALVASDGEWVSNGVFPGRTYKSLLPKYREFDDERHFYSMTKLARGDIKDYLKPFTVKIRGREVRLGVILCEDMWCDDYSDNPTLMLIENGAEAIVNISCSPWTWRKNDKRHRVVRELMNDHGVPFLYCNNTGAQNNGKDLYIFDGNTTVYGNGGRVVAQARDYVEEILSVSIPPGGAQPLAKDPLSEDRDIKELSEGLIYGIRKFFESRPDKKVVIGLSGGIDSAVSATLLTMALGAENVYAVNMPSQFNSETTKNAARELAENLGIHYATAGIQELTELTREVVESASFERLDGSELTTPLKLSSFDMENVQARHRGSTLLSGIASALGAVYVNNGNKTETALGYATLYGDVNGAIAVLADVYKWQVYALGSHLNAEYRRLAGRRDTIPEAIFNIKPSAELSPDQNVDEGKGDPMVYPYHDRLIRAFVEFRKDPEDILRWYEAGTLEDEMKMPEEHRGVVASHFPTPSAFIENLEWAWNSLHRNYFKRVQGPMIIAVSKRAFGFDLRESLNGPYYTRTYLEMRRRLLARPA